MFRASAVLAADDFWYEKTGQRISTQKAAIELAVQIEGILCDAGEMQREDRNFATGGMSRWQDSVSKGLRELGLDGKRFLKK